MDGTSIFQMVSGIGKSFGDGYEAGEKAKFEREAPGLIEGLFGMRPGAGATTLGEVTGATRAASPKLPTFADPSAPSGDYTANLFKRESNNNPNAQAATSSARGLGQFTRGTWNATAKQHPDLALTPVGNGQDGRTDPEQMLRATKALTADNEAILGRAGLPVTDATRYSLHLLGAGGGPRFVAAAVNSPDAPAIGFVRPEQVRANRSIFFEKDGRPKSAGTVLADFGRSFGGAAPSATPRVAVANNEAETQALEQRMGMVPPAERPATAEADLPAIGASPAGFVLPGAQADAPPVRPAPGGFAGFGGGGASRFAPEQLETLKAAYRNPNTRPMATAMLTSMLQGKDSSWSIQDLGNGRRALFDAKSARMVPLPGTGDSFTTETDEQGNLLSVNGVTGERKLLKAGREDKFTYNEMPGVGMVALHPTDPSLSRVIIAGKQPRPLTQDEFSSFRIPEGTGAGMGTDGKPFTLGGTPRNVVNVDTKGAGKFAEKASEHQAKRYSDIVEAADNSVRMRGDVETLADLGGQIATGKGAQVRLTLAQYANAFGLDSVAQGLTGGKLGEMEAFGAIADKLTPQMRVPGSGATSDMEMRTFRNAIPNLLKTPEGNKIVADTFRGLLDYQAAAGDLAGKALRGEVSQAEADQALRALPSPFENFKGYQRGAGKPATGAGDGTAKGLPSGYTAGRVLFEARQAVRKGGKDKAAIAERLRSYGLDPAELDRE